MKSKAPLILIEQLVMLLIFALTAALCLSAFVKSDNISKASETRSAAVLAAQTAADIIRTAGGETLEKAAKTANAVYEDGVMTQYFDSDWNILNGKTKENAYILTARDTESENGVKTAEICVLYAESNETIFKISAARQTEVTDNDR